MSQHQDPLPTKAPDDVNAQDCQSVSPFELGLDLNHFVFKNWDVKAIQVLKAGSLNWIYRMTDHQGKQTILRQMPHTEDQKRFFATLSLYKLHSLVPVIDCIRQGSVLLVREELVAGKPLSEWRRGEVKSLEALIISGVQICRSLKELYESEGILHLDIKPENLMLDHHEQGTLIDFGSGLKDIQRKNMLKCEQQGTVRFMSPERWLDPNLMGPQTDLYALSMTMAHWLSLTEQPHFPLWQWLLMQQKNLSMVRVPDSTLYDQWARGLIQFWPQA